MPDFIFSFLSKSDFDIYAPRLFDLLYRNMSEIAPEECSYEEQRDIWFRTYGGAFGAREARKIVLIHTREGELVGFFGYCAAGDTFLMEEIQFEPQFQTKYGIFRKLYEFVMPNLPNGIEKVESYAHKSNSRSLAIQSKLGLCVVGENESGNSYHLMGDYEKLLGWLHMRDEKVNIKIASEEEREAVYAIRFEVFVDEQQVPPEIELDEEDAGATHILAEKGGNPVGCARLLLEGESAHIGRLAVKKVYRGCGIGADICRFIIDYCRARGYRHFWLNAQLRAADFYKKLGFLPVGETFMEAGIEHIRMEIKG